MLQVNAMDRIRSYAEDLCRDRKTIVKILIIILILMTAVVLRLHSASESEISIDEAESEAAASVSEIYVDIGGAVISPGVYKVTENTRLYEVIEMAGGLADNADIDMINQAEFIEDGEKIFIPEKIPAADASGELNNNGSEDVSELDSTESRTNEDSYYSAESLSSGSGRSGLVNINMAGKEELMSLDGIGEVMAERIIEYRKTKRFRKTEDIKSVKGIGDKKYEKIKQNITV